MLCNDIVPILYAGGTGGHFLSYLISAASSCEIPVITFSPNGNAHAFVAPVSVDGQGMNTDPMTIINGLLLSLLSVPKTKVEPFYCPVHICDLDSALHHFNKVIHITYTTSDIITLSKIFVAKWFIDGAGDTSNILRTFNAHRHLLTSNLLNFKLGDDLSPSLLQISWDTLYQGDPALLIYKLSKFTGIDENRFSKDSLQEWRNLTRKCINELDTHVNPTRN
jgi:hypothetical protein